MNNYGFVPRWIAFDLRRLNILVREEQGKAKEVHIPLQKEEERREGGGEEADDDREKVTNN